MIKFNGMSEILEIMELLLNCLKNGLKSFKCKYQLTEAETFLKQGNC